MNDKILFEKYADKMRSIKGGYFNSLKEDLRNGRNSYLRMQMKGSSIFNNEWIDKIEDCIYELGQIVNNPREVTTTEGSVTPIELAKKVNAESVQHLASHTQFIKEVDEKGDVVPAKILSHYSKEELHTYENKFIATFIRRLILFVEKRYEFIKTTVNLDTKDVLYIKNKSLVNGQEVEIETKVTVKKETQDNVTRIARDYINRIEKMRDYVTHYYNSAFMKELKNEKDVRKPILQTNIIRKNPLYHKCYETFLFIEKFDSLGVQYKVDRNYKEFNEKEKDALNYILLSNLLSLEATEENKDYKKSEKVYKPKLLSSIDDEMFTYGNILKGPVEFVRVDKEFTDHITRLIPKNLPTHPVKEEKEYYQKEYTLKRELTKHIKEIELLLSRKRREIAKWEKKVALLIELRNLEEAEEAREQLERLRNEEDALLNEKREAIIQAALADKQVNEQFIEEQPQGEVVEETPVEEEAPVEEAEPVIEVEETPEEVVPEEEPIVEETLTEEVVEEPVEEPMVEEPQPAKEEQPAIVEEETPVIEEPKVEETPVVEEKAQETVKEEKVSPKKAPVKKAAKPKAKKAPKPAKKPAEVSKTPVIKEEPASEKKSPKKASKPKDILEVIPGRFIVKCERGYYVNDRKFSKEKYDAKIFDDFNVAKQYKNRLGGKVIKL